MWSLYKKIESETSNDGAGLFDFSGEKLDPLKFTNGKTQADVVKEVLDAVKDGNKVIFIKGVCGSGKSAMALNLARHFDKTSVVVPIKSLQEQYERDYTKKNFILKNDKKQLKICVIKGRNNFQCPFIGGKADATDLPCDIEFREKNMDKILKFIGMNPHVKKTDFTTLTDVRRMSVAPACPYWSPLIPAEIKSPSLEDARKIKYMTVSGKEYALFQRRKGCGYYDQYEAYATADVLIFNSMKYLLEMAIGRKPKTDLDIIDECDEFLDNFADERKININRLISSLLNLFPPSAEERDAIKDLVFLANKLGQEDVTGVEKIKKTLMHDLFEKILANPYIAEGEDNNYYNQVFEIVKSFEKLVDETYVSYERVGPEIKPLFGRAEQSLVVNLVSINLAQKFKEIVDGNNVLVLMSGTLHSEEVLRDVFGLKSFKVIDAETQMPGTISKYRMGLEKNCKYENFKSGAVTREQYLKALSACVSNAKTPTLVHVSSFGDLPSEDEKRHFSILNVISKEKLIELQNSSTDQVGRFKRGEVDILFSTKCARGVDFPGEECNSIIITKYPYPNIQGLFWQILKKENPNKFMEFYLDKARRELVQKIARAVRFKGDHVLLLSPDSRVLDGKVQ
jgi:Rad3-related DNA helicase